LQRFAARRKLGRPAFSPHCSVNRIGQEKAPAEAGAFQIESSTIVRDQNFATTGPPK
jgi:hypothetical protein